MWVPISFDAIATVRFLGEYTLAGRNIQASYPTSLEPAFSLRHWLEGFRIAINDTCSRSG
jgi:hypothetical protein